MRKFTASLTVLLFSSFQIISPAFAAKGVVMTDEELDGIYAEGLNFTFGDSFFGNVNNIAKPTSPTSPTAPKGSTVINTNNPSIQFVQLGGAPTTAAPSTQVSEPSVSSPSVNAAQTDQGISPMLNNMIPVNSLMVSPAIDLSQDSPNSPISSGNLLMPTITNDSAKNSAPSSTPEVVNFGSLSGFSSPVANMANLPVNVSVEPSVGGNLASPMISPVDLASTNSPALSPVDSQPAVNNISLPTGPSDVGNNLSNNLSNTAIVNNTNAPLNNASALNSNQPTSTPTLAANTLPSANLASLTNNPLMGNSNIQNPIVLDLTASQTPGGAFNVNLDPTGLIQDTSAAALNSLGNNTSFVPTNGSTNIVDVSGLSQQNLSALININSAGSIVPVQLNINIFMNSTAQTISNNNSLNLSNYNNFSFQ